MGMGANPMVAMLANAGATGAVDPTDPNGWPKQPNGDPDLAKMSEEQRKAYLASIGAGATAPSTTPPEQTMPATPPTTMPQEEAEQPGLVQGMINWFVDKFMSGTSAKDLANDTQSGGGLTPEELEQQRKRQQGQ